MVLFVLGLLIYILHTPLILLRDECCTLHSYMQQVQNMYTVDKSRIKAWIVVKAAAIKINGLKNLSYPWSKYHWTYLLVEHHMLMQITCTSESCKSTGIYTGFLCKESNLVYLLSQIWDLKSECIWELWHYWVHNHQHTQPYWICMGIMWSYPIISTTYYIISY